jgi:hypothetical protein
VSGILARGFLPQAHFSPDVADGLSRIIFEKGSFAGTTVKESLFFVSYQANSSLGCTCPVFHLV